MKTLLEIYNKFYDPKTGWPDKGTVHSYIEVYEEILSPYRKTAKNILEIGLMNGESLRMWTEYFDGKVYGIDCDVKPIDGKADLFPIMAEGNHNVLIGDASNPEDIKLHFEGIKFDVVIEDAGHSIEQQLKIYSVLKPYIAEGGIYIIEDVQNIDKDGYLFAFSEIIDRRKIKGRYDDVLIIIK
jgi:SAM-dependent methyltransferase